LRPRLPYFARVAGFAGNLEHDACGLTSSPGNWFAFAEFFRDLS